jgi:hypothetical protein
MTLSISWDIIWASTTALATIGLFVTTICLVFYGKQQLSALNKTNKEEFLHELKGDFFTSNGRELLVLIECNLLEFGLTKLNAEEDELAFFEVTSIDDEKAKDTLKNILTGRTEFSSYEMDDFLLQHFEDLGLLYKKDIICITDVDQLFGYYVVLSFENCEIKKYIEWARQDDKDIYSNFEYVYHKLKLYQSKNQGTPTIYK